MTQRSTWAHAPMVGFDLETTGVDVENDRAVTASLIYDVPGEQPRIHSWLINPGVPIPEEAAKIHGITTEYARQHGAPPAQAWEEITLMLHELWRHEVPLAAYNGCFDLSMADREMARHLGPDVGVSMVNRYLIDPLVIDRAQDRYRKGGRKLVTVCEHYGVPLGDAAHNSDADTLATLKLARQVGVTFPGAVGYAPLPALHAAQKRWHATWGDGMYTWLDQQALKMVRAWATGNTAFVRSKFAELEIMQAPDDESVAACVADTRRRAADILASSREWPMRERAAVEV